MEFEINTRLPINCTIIADLIDNKIVELSKGINHTAFLIYHGKEFEIHINAERNYVDLLRYNGKKYERLSDLFLYIDSLYKTIKVKKYEHKTIKTDNAFDLDISIEKLLNKGFELRGETKVLNMLHDEVIYVQTMTRECFIEQEVPIDDK